MKNYICKLASAGMFYLALTFTFSGNVFSQTFTIEKNEEGLYGVKYAGTWAIQPKYTTIIDDKHAFRANASGSWEVFACMESGECRGTQQAYREVTPIETITDKVLLYNVVNLWNDKKSILGIRYDKSRNGYSVFYDENSNYSFEVKKAGILFKYKGGMWDGVSELSFYDGKKSLTNENNMKDIDPLENVHWDIESKNGPGYPLFIGRNLYDYKWYLVFEKNKTVEQSGIQRKLGFPIDSFFVQQNNLYVYYNSKKYRVNSGELLPDVLIPAGLDLVSQTIIADIWQIRQAGKLGLYDALKQQMVIPAQYKQISVEKRFDIGSGSLYKVRMDNSYALYNDRLVKKLLPDLYEDIAFSASMNWAVRLKKTGKWNVYDLQQKKLLFPTGYDGISAADSTDESGLQCFIIRQQTKLGLFGKKGDKLLDFGYEEFQALGENYVAFKTGGKYGIYDVATRKEVCKPLYNTVSLIKGGESKVVFSLVKNGVTTYKDAVTGVAKADDQVALQTITIHNNYLRKDVMTLTQYKDGKWRNDNGQIFDDYAPLFSWDYCLLRNGRVERHQMSGQPNDHIIYYPLPVPAKITKNIGEFLLCQSATGKIGLTAPGKLLFYPGLDSLSIREDSILSITTKKMVGYYSITMKAVDQRIKLIIDKDKLSNWNPQMISFEFVEPEWVDCPVCSGGGSITSTQTSETRTRKQGTYTDYQTVTDVFGKEKVVAVQKASSFKDTYDTKISTSKSKSTCTRCGGTGSVQNTVLKYLVWKTDHYMVE